MFFKDVEDADDECGDGDDSAGQVIDIEKVLFGFNGQHQCEWNQHHGQLDADAFGDEIGEYLAFGDAPFAELLF